MSELTLNSGEVGYANSVIFPCGVTLARWVDSLYQRLPSAPATRSLSYGKSPLGPYGLYAVNSRGLGTYANINSGSNEMIHNR